VLVARSGHDLFVPRKQEEDAPEDIDPEVDGRPALSGLTRCRVRVQDRQRAVFV